MVADSAVPVLVLAEGDLPPSGLEHLVRNGTYRAVGRIHTVSAAIDVVRGRRAEVVVADVSTSDRLYQLAAVIPDLADAKVVVVSALPPEVALLTVMAAGARAFLGKPLRPALLDDALAAVVAGGMFVDPASTRWLVDLALHGHRSRPDSGLTLRQSQVVVLANSGLTNREIAGVLDVSMETVRTHRREAMKRLGVADRRPVNNSPRQ